MAVQDEQICKLQTEEPIKQALRYCMLLVGLRANNFPVDEEKIVLINWIKKYYGGHTAAEIRLAFEMAVSGFITLGEKESVVCFENFSVQYFSSIMNAYRAWAKEAINHIPKKINSKQLTAPTYEEVSWREVVQTEYDLFLQGKSHPEMWPAKEMYEQLVADKIIPPITHIHNVTEVVLTFFDSFVLKGYKAIYEKS